MLTSGNCSLLPQYCKEGMVLQGLHSRDFKLVNDDELMINGR